MTQCHILCSYPSQSCLSWHNNLTFKCPSKYSPMFYWSQCSHSGVGVPSGPRLRKKKSCWWGLVRSVRCCQQLAGPWHWALARPRADPDQQHQHHRPIVFPVAGTDVVRNLNISSQYQYFSCYGLWHPVIIAVKQRPYISYAFGVICHVFKTQTLVITLLLCNQTPPFTC